MRSILEAGRTSRSYRRQFEFSFLVNEESYTKFSLKRKVDSPGRYSTDRFLLILHHRLICSLRNGRVLTISSRFSDETPSGIVSVLPSEFRIRDEFNLGWHKKLFTDGGYT